MKFLRDQINNNERFCYNSHLYTFSPQFRDFFYFKLFIVKPKLFKKTRRGLIKCKSNMSLKRERIFPLLETFLNSRMTSGNKLTLLKHYNLVLKNFYFEFLYKDSENYSAKYDVLYNLLNTRNDYFNFDLFLKHAIEPLNYIFLVKKKRITKEFIKLKTEYNKTYMPEIVYLQPHKRFKYALKAINIESQEKSLKYESYHNRLYKILLSLLIDPQLSDI